MKRNVDLSENRMFTTPESPTGLAKLLFDAFKVIKPWDFENKPKLINSDYDLMTSANYRSLIAVGNKRERQVWKRNYESDTDQVCDCCGQSTGKKPWAKNRCQCYSMIYSPKIPWKF